MLDQPPLSFAFFSLKIPQRKDGRLSLQTEGAFLCKSMAAMLRDSTVVVIVRTCPRAIPLAMITMRKSVHGFPLISIYGMLMGLRLAALWATGAPLICKYSGLICEYISFVLLLFIFYCYSFYSFIVFYILLVFLINFLVCTHIYTRPHKLLSFNSYCVKIKATYLIQ